MKWSHSLAVYLFWPAIALITWAELVPHPPVWSEHVWDKAEHFTAYFGLGGMAALNFGLSRKTLVSILAVIAFGGALEILQGFTGRDPDIYDELANSLGALCGGTLSVLFLRLLSPRTPLVDRSAAE